MDVSNYVDAYFQESSVMTITIRRVSFRYVNDRDAKHLIIIFEELGDQLWVDTLCILYLWSWGRMLSAVSELSGGIRTWGIRNTGWASKTTAQWVIPRHEYWPMMLWNHCLYPIHLMDVTWWRERLFFVLYNNASSIIHDGTNLSALIGLLDVFELWTSS